MQTTKVEGPNNKNRVFLYTLSTCGWCKKMKKFLNDNDVAYEFLDLDTCSREDQKTAVEDLKARKLPVAFPIIMINEDTVIQGFKKDRIIEVLDL